MNPIFEAVIVPQTRDLGDGFQVRRVLPSEQRRTVGPFVFFDQMGPTVLPAGTGLDVRPHPHIGLATVTYLFDGEILHRDSLGTVQPIRPGAVNWMTAGRGIVHSERTPPELRGGGSRLFGIQTWVGLPRDREEVEPSFVHHPDSALPVLDGEGKRVRVIAGKFHGSRSPLAVSSEMFYADAAFAEGAQLELPAEHEERGIYIADGRIGIGGDTFEAGRMIAFRKDGAVTINAITSARLLLLGGEPLDGPRRCRARGGASSRRKPIGETAGSPRCRTKRSSYPCPKSLRELTCRDRPAGPGRRRSALRGGLPAPPGRSRAHSHSRKIRVPRRRAARRAAA
jgi:redox-sensitive bicupin YhaK (pirin superfamily)